MGLVDLGIIIFIFLGGIAGYRKGAIKEFISAIGFVLIAVLSFVLKNPLSSLFYENLPFFNFDGIFKGVTVLNIFLYELIAFLLIFFVLTLLWRLVVIASGIIQRIINMTIILGFPSKVLGFVLGIIHYYIIAFVVIYILVLPFFNISYVMDSRCAQVILNDTPVISNVVKNNMDFVYEFAELRDKYKNTDFNYEALDLFLKYDIISLDSVRKLQDKGKLHIDGIDSLIKKYE